MKYIKFFILILCTSFGAACTWGPTRLATIDDRSLCLWRIDPYNHGLLRTEEQFRLADQELERRGINDCQSVVRNGRSTPRQSDDARTNEVPSSGTGFFVSTDGHLVTNHHVAGKCKSIGLKNNVYRARAELVSSDAVNDIAILKSSEAAPSVAKFNVSGNTRIGDSIIVAGFPLGDYLGSDLKATIGNISALTGISNNITNMQITAPIQPGSSGGPVLNKSGNVVGIISAKINEGAMLSATGTLPQNINFAIKSDAIKIFLRINDIMYVEGKPRNGFDTADIVEEAESYTVQVQCNQ